jgi:hypothetical protein
MRWNARSENPAWYAKYKSPSAGKRMGLSLRVILQRFDLYLTEFDDAGTVL